MTYGGGEEDEGGGYGKRGSSLADVEKEGREMQRRDKEYRMNEDSNMHFYFSMPNMLTSCYLLFHTFQILS